MNSPYNLNRKPLHSLSKHLLHAPGLRVLGIQVATAPTLEQSPPIVPVEVANPE